MNYSDWQGQKMTSTLEVSCKCHPHCLVAQGPSCWLQEAWIFPWHQGGIALRLNHESWLVLFLFENTGEGDPRWRWLLLHPGRGNMVIFPEVHKVSCLPCNYGFYWFPTGWSLMGDGTILDIAESPLSVRRNWCHGVLLNQAIDQSQQK